DPLVTGVQTCALTISAAEARLRERVTDTNANPAIRRNALQALVQARASGLAALLQSLAGDPALRAVAIRGLAAFDDAATPKVIQIGRASCRERQNASD